MPILICPPLYWPIEEATWLRCVRDSTQLEAEIRDFLRYLEGRLGVSTEADMLDDLVRFQVFLLSTMDHKEPVKAYTAEYAWKDFLIDGCLSVVPPRISWTAG